MKKMPQLQYYNMVNSVTNGTYCIVQYIFKIFSISSKSYKNFVALSALVMPTSSNFQFHQYESITISLLQACVK